LITKTYVVGVLPRGERRYLLGAMGKSFFVAPGSDPAAPWVATSCPFVLPQRGGVDANEGTMLDVFYLDGGSVTACVINDLITIRSRRVSKCAPPPHLLA
jgi:hypothetical protein